MPIYNWRGKISNAGGERYTVKTAGVLLLHPKVSLSKSIGPLQ